MVASGHNAAQLPPPGLEGLNPAWSRLVTVASIEHGRTFHLLDNQVENPRLTLLCVHGNPSWSYLWRHVLEAAPTDVRVIAVDHLDMGFSERTGQFRRLATRVDDLTALTNELDLQGPIITVAHDWGGPISLGWAARHRHRLDGVVLLNTAVHQPDHAAAPRVIRAVRTRGILRRATVDTSTFIMGAFAMSNPRPTAAVRAGFMAPYGSAERRKAIGEFVEDIPLDPTHPTADALDDIAASLNELKDTPALLIWGSADKVFSDLYLHDLERRLPHASVHRHGKAGHFVSEDIDAAAIIVDWVNDLATRVTPPNLEHEPCDPLTAKLSDPTISATPAVIEMGDGQRSISFGELSTRIDHVANGLRQHGVAPGDRVALMIPPSIDLVTALYACWRMGAAIVLVDSGLGPKGMSAAIQSADPDYLIGIPKALVAARALRWPGVRICSEPLPSLQARALGSTTDLVALGTSSPATIDSPEAEAEAAVVFTSGSTGPSKGVRYSYRRIDAQKRALIDLFNITSDDRLVAAFAPFALYGPTMGIPSVVPDMDVTLPGSLTAHALGRAAVAAEATMIFASPAALTNVLATRADLTPEHTSAFDKVRLVMSAGAPVRPSLLEAVAEVFPNAEVHTPYGMTEVLPVASIELDEIRTATDGDGVCVGHPLPHVDVQIRPVDSHGEATGELTNRASVVGEVIVRAPHARIGYDRLWHTTHRASQPWGWHATGDVGHLDDDGRLWIGGRLAHVIATEAGPVTPVRPEQQLEEVAGIDMAAVVGVGPVGTQRLVAVLQTSVDRPGLASMALTDAARAAVDHDLVAVFEIAHLPVDKRHNAKIDRTRLAKWAAKALAGGKLSSP